MNRALGARRGNRDRPVTVVTEVGVEPPPEAPVELLRAIDVRSAPDVRRLPVRHPPGRSLRADAEVRSGEPVSHGPRAVGRRRAGPGDRARAGRGVHRCRRAWSWEGGSDVCSLSLGWVNSDSRATNARKVQRESKRVPAAGVAALRPGDLNDREEGLVGLRSQTSTPR